jgi:hypothetical protein
MRIFRDQHYRVIQCVKPAERFCSKSEQQQQSLPYHPEQEDSVHQKHYQRFETARDREAKRIVKQQSESV